MVVQPTEPAEPPVTAADTGTLEGDIASLTVVVCTKRPELAMPVPSAAAPAISRELELLAAFRERFIAGVPRPTRGLPPITHSRKHG